MNHTIDVTPEGMKTKEGNARVESAMKAKDDALWEVFRNSKAFMDVLKWQEGRQRIAQVIADYHGWEAAEADEDFIQPLLDSLKAWEAANEEFFKAVAGREE